MRKPYWTTAWEWTDEQDPYCANCGYPFDRHERVIGDLECEFCFCSEKSITCAPAFSNSGNWLWDESWTWSPHPAKPIMTESTTDR